MFERFIRERGIGAACRAGAILWALMSVPVSSAQTVVYDSALSGAALDGRMLTNGGELSTNLTDMCAAMPDKDACRQRILANQMTGRQQPGQDALLDQDGQQRRAVRPRPVRVREVPSEFQKFVAASAQKILPMYGYSLFEDVPDTFAPVENIPVAPDYMIGPGDELVIKGWGQVDIDVRAVVNRNGEINLPKVGTVNVAGIHYEDLQKYLKSAIGRVFRNFDLNVTLGALRSIQVFVVGQARSPGTYTVSSLSTLVNALFVSGGPSNKGSMRHIQVKRNGRVVTEFDLYDLLLKGDKTKDVSLQPGDVIYIPPVGHLVAISGSVNNPAIYELKDGNTTLADLIELAGGITSTASGQKAKIERIEKHKGREVEEFQLDLAGLVQPIKDGDYVDVMAIDARFDNAVTLRGNVAHPGRYPWKEGMRVRDLIPNMESLIVPEYWKEQNQAEPEKAGREDRDQEYSGGQDRMARGDQYGAGSGASLGKRDEVRQDRTRPGTDYRSPTNSERKKNAQPPEVRYGTSEINLDYAVIERMKKDDLTTVLIPFNLGKAIRGDAEQNLPLQAGDTVRIFSKDDIEVPVANRSVYVRLAGEINNAGIYKALPGETLRQLVARVGGVTPDAYLFAAELDRESVREMQQKKLEEMADRMEEEVNRSQANKVQSSLDKEDVDNAKYQTEAGLALVARFRKVRATGRVVLEIPPDSVQLKDLPDIVLEDGDSFTVPAKPSVVNVMGMVYNQNAFIFRSDKTVGDYINQAGGPTRDADVSREYVLRADGSVLNAQSSSSLWGSGFLRGTLMPGDTVVVPEMTDKFVFTKELKDWSQVFYQFALGAAGVKVLFP